VLLTGFVIGDNYGRIFAITSVFFLCCFLLMRRVPNVAGRRAGPVRSSFWLLLKNRPLMVVMAYYLSFSLGLSLFYSFYPIHFTLIGGTSAQVGIMLFFCAVTEIPCLMLAGRVVKRIGLDRVLILSGIVTVVRWILLFFVKDPVSAIFVSLLHGIGYIGFSYCVVVYINDHVPMDLRATGQSFNVLIGNVFSRVIFGYLGGLASQTFGVNWVMLTAGIILAGTTLLFAVWSSHHREGFA
jgi:PPP family 3-phenylpropionic acid transporter